MRLKVWYIFSLGFLLYNLVLLYDVRYARSYAIKEFQFCGHKKFLACLDFGRLRDLDETGLNPKKQMATFQEFIHYSALKISRNLPEIEVPINLKDKFIFKKHFCFNLDKSEDFNRELTHFLKHNFKLFVYSHERTPFFFQSIYSKRHLNISLNHFHFKVLRQVVFEMEFPYSDCARYRKSFSKDIPYNLYNCLNLCLKERDSSLYHLYDSFDSGILDDHEKAKFDLANIFRKFHMMNTSTPGNMELIELLESCKRRCPGDGCVWETYAAVTVHFGKEKHHEKEYIEFTEIGYQAYPAIAYFYLQVFGLIALFTGTSVANSVPKLVVIVFRSLNLHNTEQFQRIFPRFAFAVMVLCWLIEGVKIKEMVDEYLEKTAYPNKTVITDYSMKVEPFGLILCIPIEVLMNRTVIDQEKCIQKNETNFAYNSEIDLEQMTFEQLERLTKPKRDGIVKKIVLTYAAKEFEADWRISKKVFFRSGIYRVRRREIHGLLRCFRVSFKFKREKKFMAIMTIATLKIHLRQKVFAVYLIGKDQFSSSISLFDTDFSILKASLRFSPTSLNTNCTVYHEIVQSNITCRGRGYCLDVCKTREFLSKYQRIPINSVLQRKMFEGYRLSEIFFSTKIDKQIEAECAKNYSRRECHQEEFWTTLKSTFQHQRPILELDVYFEMNIIKELEQSFGKLLINILNLISILWAGNIFQLLMVCFSVIRRILRIQWHEFYKFFFIFICFCGFLVNIYVVFEEIIRSELVDSGYVAKLSRIQLPTLIFCLKFDEHLIDEQHTLNGERLRRLTRRLTYQSVFKRIAYYNRTHFVDHQFNQTADSPISLVTFYYLNMKCFAITNSLVYDYKYLYFKNDSYVLRVYLNLELVNQERRLYILYNSKEKRQFNEVYTYRVGKADYTNHTIEDAARKVNEVNGNNPIHKYKIRLERFDLVVDDKFQNLKRPQRLFCRKENIFDSDTYLEKMKRNFNGRYRLTTKSIPLLEDEFDFQNYEINEPLFEQFYLQVQNYSDHYYPQNTNSEREVWNFYTQKFVDSLPEEPDFEFGVIFSARKMLQTNDDNVATLIQSCFNSLSLWLNFCILDLHRYFDIYSYFAKLSCFFETIRNLLMRLKAKIDLAL